MTVAEAYKVCREIARKEAKNFYYAFVALPSHKRDAICAVYAFMRHADDLSDDESLSLEERRTNMEGWLEAWHSALQGHPTTDPVFIALADAQTRFGISSELLDQLVEGTAMDLQRARRRMVTIPTPRSMIFTAIAILWLRLWGWFASVFLGIVIRAQRKLAEETGIAFQLTNILRDVREDVERRRIYLPLEDLRRHNVDSKNWRRFRRFCHKTSASCSSRLRRERKATINRAMRCFR